ncbi:hypothetical protein [Fusobacterium sp. PH5-44]|uniref:hypothetical protein n=1 Tax=unclassified Fusobacterium TaxID=2648384 RepID=UPI003D258BE2
MGKNKKIFGVDYYEDTKASLTNSIDNFQSDIANPSIEPKEDFKISYVVLLKS